MAEWALYSGGSLSREGGRPSDSDSPGWSGLYGGTPGADESPQEVPRQAWGSGRSPGSSFGL